MTIKTLVLVLLIYIVITIANSRYIILPSLALILGSNVKDSVLPLAAKKLVVPSENLLVEILTTV